MYAKLGQKISLGVKDHDLFPELADAMRENDLNVLNANRTLEIVESIPDKDGIPRKWFVYKFPFTDPSGRKYLAGIGINDLGQEVESYKEALSEEMEKQTYAAINSFISGINHEVKSPLQAISTGVGNLIDEASGEFKIGPKEKKEILQMIKVSTNSIEHIVSNCMSFGGLGGVKKNADIAKTIMLDMKSVNVGTLIKETVDLFKCSMDYKENPVKIDYEVPKNLKSVLANHVMRQILINLISNGQKAIVTHRDRDFVTKEGRILIRAMLEDEQIVIEVEDNGRGIPNDAIEKLFNPFFGRIEICPVWGSDFIFAECGQPTQTLS
jgi:signal transduction histidine kinase